MAKILIIDDDPDIRHIISVLLTMKGHQPLSASNRAEGKSAIEKEKPALIILDVMMEEPDDGIKLAQELAAEGSKIPIIMLTSMNKVLNTDAGIDADVLPVSLFLEKPVKPDFLYEKVESLLGA